MKQMPKAILFSIYLCSLKPSPRGRGTETKAMGLCSTSVSPYLTLGVMNMTIDTWPGTAIFKVFKVQQVRHVAIAWSTFSSLWSNHMLRNPESVVVCWLTKNLSNSYHHHLCLSCRWKYFKIHSVHVNLWNFNELNWIFGVIQWRLWMYKEVKLNVWIMKQVDVEVTLLSFLWFNLWHAFFM